MTLTTLTPKKAINKAYLKERINRADMAQFKAHFKLLLDRINAVDNESEENRKNSVSDFLKSTHYAPAYEINTRGREDLVIHTGKTAKDSVGVLFEIKKPDSSEMMTAAKPNAKALQQLVFYYLRERIEHKNLDIKHLIATDIFNWYIFDENLFDKHIYRNPKFQKGYETYKQSGKDTAFFYNEIAKPLLEDVAIELECTHFNLKTYEKAVRNADLEDDNQLIALYKILSPVHLLKLPFANDSNQLDKGFYAELLHIIGLEEVKEGGKKLINRKAKPDEFSLLENTLTKLENKGFSDVSHLSKLGSNKAEQAYSIALELSITWVNRILFLKLLEAQLVSYHRGDKSYRFLNPSVIHDCDRLNKLFFEVLAEKPENRKGKVKTEFEKIPYLNSSLFERTELERKTIEINYLDDNEPIPILANTVLKDDKGKKRTGNLPTLQYLFEFLDAYDFASEGTEGIQDDKRTLINASVLGLIFEKINGYKDGSFFTPCFITMYMCRETIRRAVVQKFKETNLPNFINLVNFDDLKDAISDRKQANDIINSLKICDPAVGSGHFLVSALNEIIAIKSDLGILLYRDGKRVKDYKIEVVNDELIVFDEEAETIFDYQLGTNGGFIAEKQRIQEMLFHEKQTLIEYCLFGVDINPNSVKICRLRLWIELLKNAYYVAPQPPKGELLTTPPLGVGGLETLPNIDINIKQGNSLISRFKLNDDLSDVFKKQKFSYKAYRSAVEDYKNTNSKEAKTELQTFISDIKEQFQTVFHSKIKENKELAKFKGQLYNLQNQGNLFGGKVDKIEEDRLEKLVTQYEQKVKDIKDNVIYRDAFEWRFEFPEVLDTEGGYVGFDVVIGNPPYFSLTKDDTLFKVKTEYETYNSTGDIYALFYEKGEKLLKPNGILTFITSNKWLRASYGSALRNFILDKTNPQLLIDFSWYQVFENASVDTNILSFEKNFSSHTFKGIDIKEDFSIDNQKDKLEYILKYCTENQLSISFNKDDYWNIKSSEQNSIKEKIFEKGRMLESWNFHIYRGILTGFNEAFIIDNHTKQELTQKNIKNAEIIQPLLRGRDVERYGFENPNLWLINTYNGFMATIDYPNKQIFEENGITYLETFEISKTIVKRIEWVSKTKARINRVDVEKDYPSIFDFLKKFEQQLVKREDSGNHWTNLRNCAYNEEFNNEKLIWAETMRVHKTDIRGFPRFGYDNSSFYTDKTVFIGIGKNIKYLLGFLNSKIGRWLIQEYVTKLDTGGYMMQKIFLDKVPIADISETEQKPIIAFVEQILAIKKATPSVSTAELEGEIDKLVYGLYGLSEAEIGIIESAVK